MNVKRLLKERVAHWDDERDIGNSLIVMLRDGWKFGTDTFQAEHVRGFDTVAEARAAVRAAVPCSCPTCGAAVKPADER